MKVVVVKNNTLGQIEWEQMMIRGIARQRRAEQNEDCPDSAIG
jgi:hypothetical protein